MSEFDDVFGISDTQPTPRPIQYNDFLEEGDLSPREKRKERQQKEIQKSQEIEDPEETEFLESLESDSSQMNMKVFKFGLDFIKFSEKDSRFRNEKGISLGENLLFDPTSIRLLSIIFATCLKKKDLTNRISSLELSRKIAGKIKTRTIRERMKKFSTWGFLTVSTKDWEDGANEKNKYMRMPMLVTLNPLLKLLFNSSCGVRERNNAFRELLSFGVSREEERLAYAGEVENVSFQGFKMLVRYGYPEEEYYKHGDLVGGIRASGAVEKKINEKELKVRLDRKWRELGEKFVKCAAITWERSNIKLKQVAGSPAWSLPVSTLTASAKKQRYELIKVFESVGGGVAAAAWTLFCGSKPELDEKGKVKFMLESPHTQSVFVDKRPEQFSKNLGTIKEDMSFIKGTSVAWKEETEPMLRRIYGDLLLEEPRDGHHKDFLGRELGRSPLD